MEKLCKVHAQQYVFIGNPKFTNQCNYIKFNCRQSTASLTDTKTGNEASYKEEKIKNILSNNTKNKAINNDFINKGIFNHYHKSKTHYGLIV